jgi:hypothetical protein
MATPESHKDDGKSSKWKIMLNPFRCYQAYGTSKTPGPSYFALFRPLHDVQSRLILFGGVVLAVAAGAPLPIIGQSQLLEICALSFVDFNLCSKGKKLLEHSTPKNTCNFVLTPRSWT